MLPQDIEIIDNDEMLNDLKIEEDERCCNIYKHDIRKTVITKYVYKNDNAVFLNKESKEMPKLKCKFTLHTDRKSSYVAIYDRENKEIFLGNYLWANEKAKDYNEFLKILKRLHDFKSVVKNFS